MSLRDTQQLAQAFSTILRTEVERRRWNNAAAVVLAATRSDSDKTQAELAKLVGVSRNVIANIESGRKRIELSDLIMICRALKVDSLMVLNRILLWYEPDVAQRHRESRSQREVREGGVHERTDG